MMIKLPKTRMRDVSLYLDRAYPLRHTMSVPPSTRTCPKCGEPIILRLRIIGGHDYVSETFARYMGEGLYLIYEEYCTNPKCPEDYDKIRLVKIYLASEEDIIGLIS